LLILLVRLAAAVILQLLGSEERELLADGKMVAMFRLAKQPNRMKSISSMDQRLFGR